jgi:hypothetical protein
MMQAQMAFFCLIPRTIFENSDEEIRLCKNLEIDAVNLCTGVIVVGYETDPVDDRNGYVKQQSE